MVSIERRSAALLDQAQCPLEHACRCLGCLGPIVLVVLGLGLRLHGKWIDAQELWPLLLQTAAPHATCPGRVQDGARGRGAERHAAVENRQC